jgi:hypothetical protein
MTIYSNPPEQGHLVTVWQRYYVVAEVAKSTFSDRPMVNGILGCQDFMIPLVKVTRRRRAEKFRRCMASTTDRQLPS